MARCSAPLLPLLLLQLLPLLALLVSAGDKICDLDKWLDDAELSIDRLDVSERTREQLQEAERADGRIACATLRRIHKEADIDLPFRQRKLLIRDPDARSGRRRRARDGRGDRPSDGEGRAGEQNSDSPKLSSNPEAKLNDSSSRDLGEAQSRSDLKSESKKDPKPDSKVDSKSDSKVDSKSDSKVDSKSDSKSEPKSDSKSEPKSDSKSEPKSDSKSEPKSDSKSEPKPDSKSEPKSGSKIDSKSEVDSDLNPEEYFGSKPDLQLDSQPNLVSTGNSSNLTASRTDQFKQEDLSNVTETVDGRTADGSKEGLRARSRFETSVACFFSFSAIDTPSISPRTHHFCRSFLWRQKRTAAAGSMRPVSEVCRLLASSSSAATAASASLKSRQLQLGRFCAIFLPMVSQPEAAAQPQQPDAATATGVAADHESKLASARSHESSPATPGTEVVTPSAGHDQERNKQSWPSGQSWLVACRQSRATQPATPRLCTLLPMSRMRYADRLQFSSSGLPQKATSGTEPMQPAASAEADQELPTRARQVNRSQPAAPTSSSASATLEELEARELLQIQQLANARFMQRLLHAMDAGRRRQAARQLQKLQRRLLRLSRSVRSLATQRRQQTVLQQRMHELHAAVAGLQLQSAQKLQGCEVKADALASRLASADARLRRLQLQQGRMRASMQQLEQQLASAHAAIAANQAARDAAAQSSSAAADHHFDCSAIRASNQSVHNGVHTLRLTATMSLPANCDMEAGGWTVVLARIDGAVDFYRNWTEYRQGFGDPLGEHFIGLDALSQLTRSGSYQLWVELTDWDGMVKNVFYKKFCVLDERFQFQLLIGNFHGDSEVGDSLSSHANSSFSTYDNDNDLVEKKFGGSCAKRFHAGFWYFSCYRANPTGRYYNGGRIPDKKCDGLVWKSWKGPHYSLKSIIMKIRRMD